MWWSLSFFVVLICAGAAEEVCAQTTQHIQKIVIYSEQSQALDITQEYIASEDVSLEVQFVDIKEHREITEALQPFAGKAITRETLQSIKDTILSVYQKLGYPLATVLIPEQEILFGRVAFAAGKAFAGKVSYQGNQWFPDTLFAKNIPLHSEEPIEEDKLFDDVAWMNRNPFHHTEIIFAPGENIGATDVTILTKDRRPFSVYAGFDNTGIGVTGHNRLSAGFNWGNAFGINDILSYQFTTSDDFHKFRSNYVNYTSFLPWKHILIVYGAYSTIYPKITDFRTEGTYAQGSIRYEMPIRPIHNPFLQQFNLGFDFKFLNSNLFFTDQALPTPIITHAVNISQFVASYQFQHKFSVHSLLFKLEMTGSFTPWFPHQNKSDYDDLRPGASPYYAYGDLAFGYTVGDAKTFSLASMLRCQAATGPLMPSEQFSLGGYSTVRGYDESVYLADNSLCFNLELRAPRICVSKKFDNELIFLVFQDLGWGGNFDQISGIVSNEYLWSVGPGIRWDIRPYLMTRLDYGFRLHSVQFQGSGLGKVHFGISARY